MTLEEIILDIHDLEQDLRSYERKYGVLSETFYQLYMSGEEPEDDAWVLDWNDWAGAYEIWLERRQQYQTLMKVVTGRASLGKVIERAARREPIPVPA